MTTRSRTFKKCEIAEQKQIAEFAQCNFVPRRFGSPAIAINWLQETCTAKGMEDVV